MHNGANLPRRGRGRGRGHGLPQSTVTRQHGEDTQPNETIDKRRMAAPPSIRTVTAPQRYNPSAPGQSGARGKGFGPRRGRGYGSVPRGGYPAASGWSRQNFDRAVNVGSSRGSDSRFSQRQPNSSQDRHIAWNNVGSSHAGPSHPSSRVPTDTRANDLSAKRRPPQTPSSTQLYASSLSNGKERSPKRRKLDGDYCLPSRCGDVQSSSRLGIQACPRTRSPGAPQDRLGSPSPRDLTVKHTQSLRPLVAVKQEARSPSPSGIPEKRLVSSGCTRFNPLPVNCQRKDPFYKANRREWAQVEMGRLEKKGLRPTKWLTRDDGMVIEWTSTEPVWSDTLEPDVISLPSSVREIAPNPRSSVALDVFHPTSSELSSHPEPSNRATRCNDIRKPSPPSPSRSACRSPSLAESAHVVPQKVSSSSLATPPVENFPVDPLSSEGSHASYPASDTDIELGDLSLKFLERYLQMFDAHRADLLVAYHPDALFSFRVHSTSTHPQHHLSGVPRNVFLGRERIGRALRLLSSYKVCQGETSIAYDLLPGSDSSLISCYGTATNVDEIPPLGVFFGQSFVLRRNDNASDVGRWPLVAVVHQITIGNFVADIFTPEE